MTVMEGMLVGTGRGSFFGLDAADGEDDRDAKKADDGDIAQIVDVGVDGGLDVEAIRRRSQALEARDVGPHVVERRPVPHAEGMMEKA
jgi:hypothetical protein